MSEKKLSPELIKGIVKYIYAMYSPSNIEVENIGANYWVYVYMDEIDDRYITNSFYHDIDLLKERNLQLEIRRAIYDFFGVYTTGLNLSGFSPMQTHSLTIEVKLNH